MMTEEIEERNQLLAYFNDSVKNSQIAKNIVEIFSLGIRQHLKTGNGLEQDERKEIFDALVLQVLKCIAPENLKFFVTDPELIEKLVK